MANILSKEQCDKIEKIRKQIRELNMKDWMCEGGPDTGLNQFFNNADSYFLADYDGNIIESNMKNVPLPLRDYAKLEGQICRICGYEEYNPTKEDFEI